MSLPRQPLRATSSVTGHARMPAPSLPPISTITLQVSQLCQVGARGRRSATPRSAVRSRPRRRSRRPGRRACAPPSPTTDRRRGRVRRSTRVHGRPGTPTASAQGGRPAGPAVVLQRLLVLQQPASLAGPQRHGHHQAGGRRRRRRSVAWRWDRPPAWLRGRRQRWWRRFGSVSAVIAAASSLGTLT
jgi:hypothetical protein